MSEINSKTDSPSIESPKDVIDSYNGTKTNPDLPDNLSRIGVEMEYNFYDTTTLNPIDEQTSAAITAQGERNNIPIHREPSTTTLETLTDPFTKNELTTLLDQINNNFLYIVNAAQEHNCFPSCFAHLPHVRPEDHHITGNERYRAFFKPHREDMTGAFESFLEPSIQTSVSYEDWDHLLRITRLSIALEPFILLSTEACGGVFHGAPVDHCPRMHLLPTRGRNGGIPDFYLSARSGEEFINAHINFTMNHPHVFACVDFDGNLQRFPNEIWSSFNALEDDGLGPKHLLNYRQAQSESWRRTINIAEIRDDDGTVNGHRAEISSLFATGLQHQPATAVLLTHLMAYDDNFYRQVKSLLLDHGIDLEALDECRALLEQNYTAAENNKGHFHDLPFGTKTLKDFALRFADIVESCLSTTDLANYAPPLLHILREGRPDWLVYREYFPSVEAAKTHLQNLPGLTQKHQDLLSPKSCADWVIPKIL